MPKLKTNKAASKRYGFTAKGKVKEHLQTQDTDYLQKQVDKKCLENKILMQTKHVLKESKNYYHMVNKKNEE